MQIYRYPLVTILTIFVPMWLLGLINLVIFWQDSNLSGRAENIATVLVGLLAFIPSIRSQIPTTPYVTMVDLMIYAFVLSNVLCLLDSVLIVGERNYEF